MKKTTIITFIFALIIIIGGVVAFVVPRMTGSDKSAPKHRTFTINYAGSYSNAMMFLIKEKKFIEKYLPENTELKWTNIAASTEMRDGVVSGSIDIAGLSLPSYLSAVENGIPMDIISYAGNTPIKMYSNKDGINSLADVKPSDKIALVGLNTILHVAFLVDAEKQFGDSGQFNNSFVVMPHADGLAALVTGNEIRAYITTFPTTIKAEATPGVRTIHDFTDTVNNYGVGSVNVVLKKFYKENPDLVDAFLKAQKDAVKYADENIDETAKLMATSWKIDTAEVKSVLESMPMGMSINGYDTLADFLYKSKFLKNQPLKFNQLENYNVLNNL
ncbi:MAG: ABC transporter substrate-binding protein [Candidatus Saccharimonadales bacterium]